MFRERKKLNYTKLLIIGLFSVLLYHAYITIKNPSKEVIRKSNLLFQDIISKEVDKLSIVIHEKDGYSYLMITDKPILKEFMNALKNDTFIPNTTPGHHRYRFLITLHSKDVINLIECESDSPDIKMNLVDITLFDVKAIDILNIYYKSVTENIEFSRLFGDFFGFGKYSMRNEELYNVLNKYVKGKGLKYNPSSKKWSRTGGI